MQPLQDDAEGAPEQPLVSASVGCDAVFLIGGATRDVPPTALLLRSGDVVVMSGEKRSPGPRAHILKDCHVPPAEILC